MGWVSRIISQPVIWLIKLYRLIVSPILGPRCRFYPSCSAYALEAISCYGIFHGGWLAVKRIGKCHPWHEGGIDPVPPNHLKPDKSPRHLP